MKMAREMVMGGGEKMRVKRDDLEQQNQNPSLTCTLTFVSKIHMNFSFQNDDI